MGPHVKEKGRVKGAQIGSTLMHITIKEAEVVIAGPWGISQAFSIGEIVVKLWG
jgi:flagellar biosynthesis protein FlhB